MDCSVPVATDFWLCYLQTTYVIVIVIVILWPSIRMIKVGTSNIEIEKITLTEGKEEIYLSWILDLKLFQTGRAF
jgi:hypothetical protein